MKNLSSRLLFKNVNIKTKVKFYLLFCMGMKLGPSH